MHVNPGVGSMPMQGSNFSPGGPGYGPGIGMGGYGNLGQNQMRPLNMEADPLGQSMMQNQQVKLEQDQLANMFKTLLMAALFGSAPNQGGAGGFGPASEIPGFDPSRLMQLMGRGSSSPFNPNYAGGGGGMGSMMGMGMGR